MLHKLVSSKYSTILNKVIVLVLDVLRFKVLFAFEKKNC